MYYLRAILLESLLKCVPVLVITFEIDDRLLAIRLILVSPCWFKFESIYFIDYSGGIYQNFQRYAYKITDLVLETIEVNSITGLPAQLTQQI